MPNELDNRFQEALDGYESPVDKAALWQAVRPARRKRRLGWLWLLLLALCATGTGTWWWLGQSTGHAAMETLAQMNAAPASPGEDGAAKMAIGATSEARAEASRTAAPYTPDGMLPTAATPATTRSAATTPHASTTGKVATPTTAGLATTTLREPLAGDGVAPTTRPTGAADTPLAQVPAAADMGGTVAAASLVQSAQAPALLPSLGILPLSVLMEKTVQVPPTTAAPDLDIRRRRAKHQPWSVSLAGGYHASLRQLSDTIGGQWADLRVQSEQVLEARSVDLMLGYHSRRGWHLRSGLGHSAQHTRFERQSTSYATDSIMGIVRIELSPAGDTIGLAEGRIARYQATRWHKRTYNTATFVEIPLLAGYTLRRGPLDLCLEGGLRLALTRRRTGDLLDASAQVADWAEVPGYRTGLLWRVQAGATVGYTIAPQWQVGLGAQVIASPTAWTAPGAGFREGYQWLGVRAAVSYRW